MIRLRLGQVGQTGRAGRAARVARRATLLMLGAAVLAALALLLAPTPPAASARGQRPAATPTPTTAPATAANQHALDLATPAIVRIVTLIQGQVIWSGGDVADGKDFVFPLNGGMYQYAIAGSGVFISPTGAILTADHVVDVAAEQPTIEQAFVNGAAREQASIVPTFPANLITQEFQALYAQGDIHVAYQVVQQKAFLSTAYTGPLQDSSRTMSYEITKTLAHSTPDKEDIAVVQVQANDVPFVKIAPTSNLKPGDTVTAIGYPAGADTMSFFGNSGNDFSALFNPQGTAPSTLDLLLEATASTGQVTTQKALKDGTAAFQANNIAYHGSSGGPLINANGDLIGMVDARSEDTKAVYLIPSEVVKAYAAQAGITKTPTGRFMTAWAKALGEYYASAPCDFATPAHDLQQVQTEYPDFGGIKPFVADANAKAAGNDCPPPGPSPLLLAGIGLGVLVVLAGALLVFVRRRRPSQPDAASGEPPAPQVPPTASAPLMPPIAEVPPTPPVAPMPPVRRVPVVTITPLDPPDMRG